MKYKLYTTSEKAWDAMIDSIEKAQKSVYIEMYIFLPDTKKSHDFIGKLKQGAKEGVKVIIVADSYGSKALQPQIDSLRKSGIEIIFFSHWLRHIHKKLLIIDEKIAYIGGVNIGERFRKWNDLELKVQGKIVRRMMRSFAYTYLNAGGENTHILHFRKKEPKTKLKIWLIDHWPAKNIYTLKKHYIKKISAAQKSIRIITPYFTPPRWLITQLDNAKGRGVEIEILVPEESDWKIMNMLNYKYIRSLNALGMNILLSKKMNHSKLLIIDEKEGLIGSQNVDHISFQINAEIGIFFRDKYLLEETLKIWSTWKKDSLPFKPEKYRMRVYDYIALGILKLFYPIL